MKSLILSGAFIGAALAQSGPYGQCGGIGWTGATTCVSGYVCTYLNDWYSQCVPGTATTTKATTTSTTTTTRASTTLITSTKTTSTSTRTSTTSSTSPAGTGFEWFGINESGAEFGQGTYPGVWGKDFIFPDTTTIGTLIGQGFNIFRLTFAMERMTPSGVTGAVDPAYLANLTAVVDYITSNGAYAIVDPHNFGRFNGNIITSTSDFATWWTNVATPFKSNSKVIFDTNNEYHDEDQTLILNLNQAAINAIRAAGATSQYIFAEGNGYSGAWVWNTTNNNLAALTDSSDKLVYEMHQYFDSDGSGTSATCVSSTIGVNRVIGATEWLRANGKVGILGEYGAGANSVCEEAVQGLLDHLKANSDVWKGALWWAAGPWWGTYIYSFEPPTGTAYEYYDSLLTQYVP